MTNEEMENIWKFDVYFDIMWAKNEKLFCDINETFEKSDRYGDFHNAEIYDIYLEMKMDEILALSDEEKVVRANRECFEIEHADGLYDIFDMIAEWADKHCKNLFELPDYDPKYDEDQGMSIGQILICDLGLDEDRYKQELKSAEYAFDDYWDEKINGNPAVFYR